MNFKKHMVLIVGGGVTLVLVLGAVFVLFRLSMSYGRVDSELQDALRRLNVLCYRDPYPSEVNVALVQTNLADLRTYHTELMKFLLDGQIDPANLERAQFKILLGNTIRKLQARSNSLAIELPQRFGFGFDRYAKGDLPAPGDVPRLVLQLKQVEAICMLLSQARISSIQSIGRQEFEASAQVVANEEARRGEEAAPQEASAPVPKEAWTDSSGLFSRETYVVTFTGKDSAVWDFLILCSKARPFIVVSRINEESTPPILAAQPTGEPGTTPSPAESTGAAGAPVVLSHDQRIASGREPVTVTAEVDVYRFLRQEKQEGQP